jgi:hypothetical protein
MFHFRYDYDYDDDVQMPEPEIMSQQELTLGKLSITDDTSSSSMEANAVTSNDDSTAEVQQTPSDHSLPPISDRTYPPWQLRFFIRPGLGGFFHTYPTLGGPFRSLKEAEDAFVRHLDELRSPMM